MAPFELLFQVQLENFKSILCLFSSDKLRVRTAFGAFQSGIYKVRALYSARYKRLFFRALASRLSSWKSELEKGSRTPKAATRKVRKELPKRELPERELPVGFSAVRQANRGTG